MKNDLRTSSALKAFVFIITAAAGVFAVIPGTAALFYSELNEGLYRDGFSLIPVTQSFCALLAAAGALVFIAGVVFLCSASGHHKGIDGVEPGWGTAVPFDFLTAAAWVSAVLIVIFPIEAIDILMVFEGSGIWEPVTVIALIGFAAELPVLGWLMSAALRFKLGGWWRNTVCYYVLKYFWIAVKWVFALIFRVLRRVIHGIRVFFSALGRLISGIPLVWKGALAILFLCITEAIFIGANMYEGDNLAVFWIIERLVLVPLLLYVLIVMRKLQNGATALANGDLSYNIDTKRMVLDFKAHGENLNRIAEGSALAVEQRMKSEHLKTALITNVSHDIKTPLTSIINYAELISNEQTDNTRITEYAEVISRQSVKLKRLLEDLIEASKASTGNLEVQLAPCDVSVLLEQAAGEYSDRMQAAGLTLIERKPDKPVRIMADSRRIWRVFDNLMNNICKYAQPGTRVYLDLEEKDNEALISFKNISSAPLNISPDELMERFVRGDGSRGGEGSGLGLSIARSLTELQNGSLSLDIDGDLFKVTLHFPVL